jgi:hypothetical protein
MNSIKSSCLYSNILSPSPPYFTPPSTLQTKSNVTSFDAGKDVKIQTKTWELYSWMLVLL